MRSAVRSSCCAADIPPAHQPLPGPALRSEAVDRPRASVPSNAASVRNPGSAFSVGVASRLSDAVIGAPSDDRIGESFWLHSSSSADRPTTSAALGSRDPARFAGLRVNPVALGRSSLARVRNKPNCRSPCANMRRMNDTPHGVARRAFCLVDQHRHAAVDFGRQLGVSAGTEDRRRLGVRVNAGNVVGRQRESALGLGELVDRPDEGRKAKSARLTSRPSRQQAELVTADGQRRKDNIARFRNRCS